MPFVLAARAGRTRERGRGAPPTGRSLSPAGGRIGTCLLADALQRVRSLSTSTP